MLSKYDKLVLIQYLILDTIVTAYYMLFVDSKCLPLTSIAGSSCQPLYICLTGVFSFFLFQALNQNIDIISRYNKINRYKIMWYRLMAFIICFCTVGQSVFKIKTDTPRDAHRNCVAPLYCSSTYLGFVLGKKNKNQDKNIKKLRRFAFCGEIFIILYVTLRTSKYGLDKTVSQIININKNMVSRFAILQRIFLGLKYISLCAI